MRKSNPTQECLQAWSCDLPSKPSVTTWTVLLRAQRWQENCWESGGREARATCPSGTERVLVDRTLGSGLVPKPGGCLSAGGGGRAGGFALDVGCDICRLRLWDCSDLLNPADQRFDGTDTSFGWAGGSP